VLEDPNWIEIFSNSQFIFIGVSSAMRNRHDIWNYRFSYLYLNLYASLFCLDYVGLAIYDVVFSCGNEVDLHNRFWSKFA